MKRFFLSFILLGCFFQLEAQERTANDTILMLENKSLNDVRDYNWLIKTLSRECKYPVAQQKKEQGLCFTGGIYCDPGRLYQPCYGTQPSTPCIPKVSDASFSIATECTHCLTPRKKHSQHPILAG